MTDHFIALEFERNLKGNKALHRGEDKVEFVMIEIIAIDSFHILER
jgi:hypothetical protein